MPRRKIAVFTGNRAEYSLLDPVIRKLSSEPSLETHLIISGSHLSDGYGKTIDEIDISGIEKVKKIDFKIPVGEKVKEILFSISTIVKYGADVLMELHPDIILLAGDRYETFSMGIAAFYLNVPIVHLEGGDLSQGGHLDDSVRHSLTKLDHLHFVTNEDSRRRVLGLGEENWRVFNVGSTVMDNIISEKYLKRDEIAEKLGIDLNKPLILFTQHPVTTESSSAYNQAKESLRALAELGYQTIIFYPCNDNGSEHIIRAINEYIDNPIFKIRKSLGWKQYFGLLKIASVVVGNSSSGIKETPAFRVPCVNIGTRQTGRLRSENVIDVPYKKDEIKKAITKAITDKNFIKQVRNCFNPYGKGRSSEKIVAVLKSISLNKTLLQKKMTF